MLRVCFTSGSTVAELTAQDVAGFAASHDGWVSGLKRHLACAVSRPHFTLRLLDEDAALSDAASLRLPCTLQLVLLPYRAADLADAQALIAAAGRDDLYAVSALLHGPVDPNLRDDRGDFALLRAAYHGSADCVAILLEAGAMPDLGNYSGSTPLLLAAAKGHLEAVQVLLAAGADTERTSSSGATALFAACHRGSAAVVRVLLEARADTEACTEGDATPLMQALKRGHLEIVQLLVQAGASTHRKNRAGVTPLVLACYGGLMEAVRVLGEAGTKERLYSAEEMATRMDTGSGLKCISFPKGPCTHIVKGIRCHKGSFKGSSKGAIRDPLRDLEGFDEGLGYKGPCTHI
ncbi:ASB2 [Symbiodinium sp. CCMP2592]|nr:ASB2 [Symbiodinium sp. CCMP2592]